MVRTKADGSLRVAAGGKAPKKTASRPVSMPSPSAGEKGGKDHLPGNRACPRETPAWQKKITFFYDKNAASSTSMDDPDQGTSNGNSKDNSNDPQRDGTSTEEFLTQAENKENVEMEEGNSSVLESSKVDESESMETD